MSGFASFISRINVLRQIPIFSQLNWFDLQRIARKATLVEYKKGALIRRQGDPPDNFYCCVSGRILAYTADHAGTKKNVEFIHRGIHFGIISALTGETHSLNFEALNDSVVLQIPKDDFHAILKSISSLAVELSQSLSQRVRKATLGTKTVFESKILTIYSPVKGTGSSTYAINLALSLQKETQKKVIFLNFSSIQSQQEKKEDAGTSPAWQAPAVELKTLMEDYEQVFQKIIKDELPLHLLNISFDAADPQIKKQISPLVSILVGNYHYVVVDLPNEMDDFVLESLIQSDVVHLLALDRHSDLKMLRQVIDRLELVYKEDFRAERIHIIIRGVHDQMFLSYEEINKTLDFNVYTVLPHIQAEQLTHYAQSKTLSLHLCDEKSDYAHAVRRISRQLGGVMVGLVLGGGAALGIAHVGVLKVLEEENIPIDIVVGSSMGALIASLWSIGFNYAALEKVAREFEKKKDMAKLADISLLPVSGIVRGGAIARWLKGHLGSKTFYSCIIPLKVVAYDLTRREEIVLESGSLVDAVRQSIAIPGVIRPITKGDQVIIDGGVLNPLPTNVLSSRGIKKIIAVNVLQSPHDASEGHDREMYELAEKEKVSFRRSPLTFMGVRTHKFFNKIFNPNIPDIIVRTLQATEYLLAEQSAQQADVVIHPNLVGIQWFELYKVDALIKAGEDAARKNLPEIRKLLEH